MSDIPSNQEVEHELKISSQFFDVVESGQKPFEIRKGDRPFKIGDVLWLREVNILLVYTGREMRKRITFCLRGWGMEDGYVALGLAPLHAETPSPPKRYLLGQEGDICGPIPCMDEHSDGDWVHWSDVKHLFSTSPKTSGGTPE